MSYTDTDKVNRILGPHKLTETTKVTLSDAELLIRAVQSEVDVRLGAIGVTPIPVVAVSPTLTYLGTITSWGVAAQVLKSLFPETTGPGESPAYAYWEKKYQDALGMITSEESINVLSGLGLTTFTSAASSYFTNHPEEEAELGRLAGASLFTTDDLGEKPW